MLRYRGKVKDNAADNWGHNSTDNWTYSVKAISQLSLQLIDTESEKTNESESGGLHYIQRNITRLQYTYNGITHNL